MKRVCVIGAGPAGLVTAKTFLQKGGYHVTVFEASDRIGGMWRVRPGEHGEKCSPDMRTNLSRFSVAFSDLSWSSVDLSDAVSSERSLSIPPVYPKAWHVGRYLQTYAHKFSVNTTIVYNTRVLEAKLLDHSKGWQISCFDSATKAQTILHFDYLIVASGFFNQPNSSFVPSLQDSTNLQHSSRFRSLSSLTGKAGKIVVVGGGISGSEAAAQAALQVSNAKHSPGMAKPCHANSIVYHVFKRPFYCFPRYIPQSSPDSDRAPTFLPLDLVLYNLPRRGGGEISAIIATVPPEKAQKGHKWISSVIGSEEESGHIGQMRNTELAQHPAYTGITDTYSEFVRSGLIVPVLGWVDKVEEDEKGAFRITVNSKAPQGEAFDRDAGASRIITDVTGVIEATGYKNNLDFFDESTKQLLDYDPSCPRIPILLSRGSVLAPKIPSLAFVGFYEGPYWSVMEMQAHFIADTWADFDETTTLVRNTTPIYQNCDAATMRGAISAKSHQVPQLWMSDYVGLVEELARQVGIKRNDSIFGEGKGPAISARYCSSDTDDDAANVIKEVADMIQASLQDAKFVAPAVFRGMQGIWTVKRRIDTRKVGGPGGTFLGTAHFHPRMPTSPKYSAEYLYMEEGTFTMDNGLSFPATRRYVYRYNEATEAITAWFADEDGESVGALFNTWEFQTPHENQSEWVARGHHWCDPDMYKNTCEFSFKGAALRVFNITYEAKGPNKDYSHQSWYERPVDK